MELKNKTTTFLLTILLLLLTFLSWPNSSKLQIHNHQAVISEGRSLNASHLEVTPRIDIVGIEGKRKNQNIVVNIPFFTNTRYVEELQHIPFLGQERRITTLVASNRYEFAYSATVNHLEYQLNYLKIGFVMIALILLRKLGKKYLLKNTVPLISLIILNLGLLFQLGIIDIIVVTLLIWLLNDQLRFRNKMILSSLVIIVLLLSTIFMLQKANINIMGSNEFALQAIAIVSEPKDVKKAIKLVESSYQSDALAKSNGCHGALHELGVMALIKLKNAELALKYATGNCEFGYYHGVLDGISLLSTDVVKSREIYRKACGVIDKTKFSNSYDECTHGSGHAFYELYDGDYNRAFKACLIWGDFSDNCNAAVSMSMGDFNAFNALHTKVEFFPKKCLAIKSEAGKISCTSIGMRYYLSDFTSLHKKLPEAYFFCQSLQGQLAKVCHGSIGDAVAYQAKFHMSEEESNWPQKYCSFTGILDMACEYNYISYMSYYHALAGLPIKSPYYCDKSSLIAEECKILVEQQSRRVKS